MHESIILQVGVKIFLKNRLGKYLLLKRSPVRYPGIKNFWDIPGGRIIPGTSLRENLQREVSEETKLRIVGRPKLLGAQDITRRKTKHIVRLTYVARTSGEPILDSDHTEFKWLTVSEMRHLKNLDEFTSGILREKLIE